MSAVFVTEAVMLAIYGQLLVPRKPVEYIIPYKTVLELYELTSSDEPLMHTEPDDLYVRKKITELIQYFEEPLNQKKIDRALQVPWAKSPPIPVSEMSLVSILNALDTAPYGELFDPVETELILAAQRIQAPLLTDQFELIHRIVNASIAVQVYDIDDFDFAIDSSLMNEE